VQLTIGEHPEAPQSEADQGEEWATQLGWQGGTSAAPSWGFELGAAALRAAVARLRRHSSAIRSDAPEWVGYWSFPVKDPMGNTVEISSADPSAWTGHP